MVKIELTVDELNFIMAALCERPFKEVAALVMKIKADAERQLNAAVASQPEQAE